MAAQDRPLYWAVNAGPFLAGSYRATTGIAVAGECAVMSITVLTAGTLTVYDAPDATNAATLRHAAASVAAGDVILMAGANGESGNAVAIFSSNCYVVLAGGCTVCVNHLPV